MRRRAAWAALAALVAAPALLYCKARIAADDARRRRASDVERLEAGFRARAAGRPCAFDDPRPDPAGPWIERAWVTLEAIPYDERLRRPVLTATLEDAPVLPPLSPGYGRAVDLLREAVRRPPAPLELGSPGTAAAFATVEALLDLADRARAESRSAEAFDVLLLLLGYAQDYAWGAGDLALLRGWEADVVESAGRVLLDHALTPARIGAILTQLDRLERSRPALQDALDLAERQALRQGLALEPAHGVDQPYRPRRPSWRHAWTWEFARAAYLAEIEAHFRRRREIAALPWPEMARESAAFLAAEKGRFAHPDEIPIERLELAAAAERALLRAALHVAEEEARTGRFPAEVPGRPRDPETGRPLLLRDGVVESPGQDLLRAIRVRRR